MDISWTTVAFGLQNHSLSGFFICSQLTTGYIIIFSQTPDYEEISSPDFYPGISHRMG
jgi:hypothetical protein